MTPAGDAIRTICDSTYYRHRRTAGPFAYAAPDYDPERSDYRFPLLPRWLIEPIGLADLPGGLASINDR